MRKRQLLVAILFLLPGLVLLKPAPSRSQDSEHSKAQALVDAAIKMTDSDRAVKLLWQATDIDPTLTDGYVYLGLYYNSRQDFAKVADVYRKLVKYQSKGPPAVNAYLNIGEAYMSFSPPKYDEALSNYRKAYELDPSSSFAALRMGEILAHTGSRAEAIRFLKQASSDSTKNATIASEARKMLDQIGGPL